jgi:hypothetical protein
MFIMTNYELLKSVAERFAALLGIDIYLDSTQLLRNADGTPITALFVPQLNGGGHIIVYPHGLDAMLESLNQECLRVKGKPCNFTQKKLSKLLDIVFKHESRHCCQWRWLNAKGFDAVDIWTKLNANNMHNAQYENNLLELDAIKFSTTENPDSIDTAMENIVSRLSA